MSLHGQQGGCTVARPRRLRHKLMLGLALVVGSVGLLLGGTAYGFRAYLNTVKTTERKLLELQQINILIQHLDDAPKPASDVNSEFTQFASSIDFAKTV